MIFRRLFAALLLLLGAALYCETSTYVDLSLYGTLGRGENTSLIYLNTAKGRISVESEGNSGVRAQVAVDALAFNDVSYLNLSRAWIKAKLPFGRLQMGKTRTTWGTGLMYNAGDVIFGRDAVDITAENLRDKTRWLTDLYLPVSDFSFLELIVIGPDIVPSLINLNTTPEGEELLASAQMGGDIPLALPVEADGIKAGLRGQTDMGGYLTLEGAYFYKGRIDTEQEATHVPALSLQTALWALDIYGASSIELAQVNPQWETSKEELLISWGAFFTDNIAYLFDLSFRLEGLVRPYGLWEPVFYDSDPMLMQEKPNYGMELYGDIGISPGVGEQYFLRGIYSPVDQSGEATFGASYPIQQNLNLLIFAQGRFGEAGDIYLWEGAGGWNSTWGLNYKY